MTADTDNIKDVYLTSFGNEPAETESGFISIAACIDTYVNEITDLKRVMSDDIYNQVNEQGALLYGNLAIMRYLTGNGKSSKEEIEPLGGVVS